MTHKQRLFLISKFLQIQNNSQRWAQEISILQSLEDMGYCDSEFWDKFKVDYNFNSFAHLKKNNCSFLHKKYLEYLAEKQEKKLKEFRAKYNI